MKLATKIEKFASALETALDHVEDAEEALDDGNETAAERKLKLAVKAAASAAGMKLFGESDMVV